jgi:hypothetical protein
MMVEYFLQLWGAVGALLLCTLAALDETSVSSRVFGRVGTEGRAMTARKVRPSR